MRARRSAAVSPSSPGSGSLDDGVTADVNAWAALESLDTGVLVLSSDLRVLYANASWTSWLGAPIAAGTSFESLVEEGSAGCVADLQATLVDGDARAVQLVGSRHKASRATTGLIKPNAVSH